MLKKKLADILEENHKPEEDAPQHLQTRVAQPPASACWQVGDQIGWEEHLIQALAKAPDDVAQKLAACIDKEVLLKALQSRDDPYLKVALLILKK
jgi:hypothetical protein